jgi:hypothetical protein
MNTYRNEPFLLEWDLTDLGDEDFFAYLVEFAGHEDIVQLAQMKQYQFPDHVFFSGNFHKLKRLDYPYNNVQWPLMSTAMVCVLKKLGQFAFRKIPVTILDDTVLESELFRTSGEPDPKYTLERFSGIQIMDHLDAFDWNQSIYKRSKYVDSLAMDISKLVLKAIPSGFPPIFRLSACPTLLFVSAEARSALEDANISGVTFRAINDYPYGKF